MKNENQEIHSKNYSLKEKVISKRCFLCQIAFQKTFNFFNSRFQYEFEQLFCIDGTKSESSDFVKIRFALYLRYRSQYIDHKTRIRF